MALAKLPPREQITSDTPLRLGVAAAIGFPDGSMTASGLVVSVPEVALLSSASQEKIIPP